MLLLLLLLSSSIPLHASSSSGTSDSISSTGYLSEWKILTKHNFSAQIRIHPHILLLVTLPWSGESRALMRDVALLVRRRNPEFSSLKLMFMFRNKEKTLADAIGASDETTVLYFHHSKPYKYQGRLRAQNILSSVHPHLLIPPEEVPIKRLSSPLELRAFLDSTDKALLLLEFCGWTPELQQKGWKNESEHGFGTQGDAGPSGNGTPNLSGVNNDQKWKDSSMQCAIGGDLNGAPWFGEFGSVTNAASEGSGAARLEAGYSCNLQEFHLFKSIFSTFVTVAREFFLPPERHRFGLVVERSLLSFLGIEKPILWSVMVHHAGCPGCSKILKEVDDLKSSMQIDNNIIAELEVGGHTQQPALPASKPSVLLFVDRSSEFSEDMGKSKEALDALRELAWHSHISYNEPGEMHGKLGSFPGLLHQPPGSSSRYPNLKLSASSQKVKTKEKENHVGLESDLNKNRLLEILEDLLQQKKEGKLSLVAKKVGFQLLSDDFKIKTLTVSSKTGIQPIQGSLELSQDGLISHIHEDDKQLLNVPTASSAHDGENSKLMDPKPSQHDEGRESSLGKIKRIVFAESGLVIAKKGIANSEDFISEKAYSSEVDKLKGEELQIEGFKGSFYFSDGDYRLVRSLTGDSKIPSLVIIDPILQQHYVYPHHKNFSSVELAGFLRDYLNASIQPYQQSESVLPIPMDASRPPFVNLDFHEADSILKVTARTLSELISGINQTSHREKDVFVLFSNNWCGFCQRMELVIREVHRALKGYINMLKTGLQYEKMPFSGGSLEDISLNLPVIYLLDCTFNDCSLIFKTINKGEVYPALVLFPAGDKSPISYEGETAVSSVIKFMAESGSNYHDLVSENGFLWTQAEKGGSVGWAYMKEKSADAAHMENPTVKDRSHEILTNGIPEKLFSYRQGAEFHDFKGAEESEAAPNVAVGSILVATERLVGTHPFDESMILILKADGETGFQGLIVNKHISWDSLHEVEGWPEVLREAHLSFGGPLAMRGLPLVALTRRAVKEQFLEVLPGIYFVDQLGTGGEIEELKSGTNRSVTDYWFFLGYVSWGWNQLFNEIAEGAWTVRTDDSAKLLVWPE